MHGCHLFSWGQVPMHFQLDSRLPCPQLFLSIFSPDIALGRCGGELVLMVEALVRKLEVCLSPLLLVKNPKMLLDFSGFGDT
ncbi:hypothetical protein V6N13_011609 [Hibiscus sabdariffa]